MDKLGPFSIKQRRQRKGRMEKAAAKRLAGCFPCMWKLGNGALKMKYEILYLLIRNFQNPFCR